LNTCPNKGIHQFNAGDPVAGDASGTAHAARFRHNACQIRTARYDL
jgi:hypothetical protein